MKSRPLKFTNMLVGITSLLSLPAVFSADEESFFTGEVLPLLEEYCYDCHGDGAKKGDFAMDELIRLGSFDQHTKKWDRVWKNLYNRNMPPANVPQPLDPEVSTVLSWIEKASFSYDSSQNDPGHVVLRRLNRIEYENTVEDIFGIDIDAKEFFPADDTGYGFDTIGEVLTLSPLLMEKYLSMAEIVMDKALGPPDERGIIHRFEAHELSGGSNSGSMRVLASRGSITLSVPFRKNGEYNLTIWASGSRAGNDLAKMIVGVNRVNMGDFEVDAEYPVSKEYKIKFNGKAGLKNEISITFPNDFYDPKNQNPKRRDRNLYIEKIELSEPQGISQMEKSRRSHLLGEWKAEKIDDEVAKAALQKWLPRLYRMPLNASELARHIGLFSKMRETGLSTLESVRQVFKAVLVSPSFLFREERKSDQKKSVNLTLLDDYALAHRMSYFLWSSVPDDYLWNLADQGKLRANLEIEFERMIKDPKIGRFITNFCGQWLQLRDLNLINPNPDQFPSFTQEIRQSMIFETEEFFKYLLKKNLPVELLLGADFSMINNKLADYYGIDGSFDEDFRKVVFKGEDLKKRGGLLTHGSILTITSNPTRTSPVKRGKWVLDNLLAAPPRDPPPGVTELEESHESNKEPLSFREQMAKHSQNPSCYSCHASMDNLGYAMGNFNAVGKWQDQEEGRPVDVSGKLSSGEKFNGVRELQKFLNLNKKKAITRCLTQKLFVYGLGRGLTYRDRLAVDEVIKDGEDEQINLADLLLKVIQSKPFQYAR